MFPGLFVFFTGKFSVCSKPPRRKLVVEQGNNQGFNYTAPTGIEPKSCDQEEHSK